MAATYKCRDCGTEFSYPFVVRRDENLDGENGIEHRREEYCPVCDSCHIADVSGVPEVVLRFIDFIHSSGYGVEEMRALDDALDGDTIEDFWRKR